MEGQTEFSRDAARGVEWGICFRKLFHMIVEAQSRFYRVGQQAGDPGKSAVEANSHLLAECFLARRSQLRSSTDWMRPTLIMEGSLPKITNKCKSHPKMSLQRYLKYDWPNQLGPVTYTLTYEISHQGKVCVGTEAGTGAGTSCLLCFSSPQEADLGMDSWKLRRICDPGRPGLQQGS